jgi:hypothetical protein
MANQRSPNCPHITFQEAIEKGRLVYEKEYTHATARKVVAQSLGYSGINGRSLSMIGALRQYGILEGSGDEQRISDDAVSFFVLDDGPERQAALHRMLFNPSFFAQIHADFGDSLPSESSLKHYLMKNGFLPKAAEDVIKVYRENIRLVENMPKRYAGSGDGSIPSANTTLAHSSPLIESLRAPQQGVTVQPIWSQSFALSKGTKAELIITGDVTREGLALLKTYIELTIRALAEETTTETTARADSQDPLLLRA